MWPRSVISLTTCSWNVFVSTAEIGLELLDALGICWVIACAYLVMCQWMNQSHITSVFGTNSAYCFFCTGFWLWRQICSALGLGLALVMVLMMEQGVVTSWQHHSQISLVQLSFNSVLCISSSLALVAHLPCSRLARGAEGSYITINYY